MTFEEYNFLGLVVVLYIPEYELCGIVFYSVGGLFRVVLLEVTLCWTIGEIWMHMTRHAVMNGQAWMCGCERCRWIVQIIKCSHACVGFLRCYCCEDVWGVQLWRNLGNSCTLL